MSKCQTTAAGLAALALFGAASALAVPQTRPLFTFIEREDNDFCDRAQSINAYDASMYTEDPQARDCFYITGKLQQDCVWDIEPKCALRVYDKPQPARNSTGGVIAGQFCEPIVASSDTGELHYVVPIDGAVRLAVAAVSDAFDGTVNGLVNNGPHGEKGEVTIKVFYNDDAHTRTVYEVPDQYYVFHFVNGADALRVAFIIPSWVRDVNILCCNNTGVVGVCYDTDFYHVTGLDAGQPYCVSVIGGLNPACDKTDTYVGIFNKNCFEIGADDDSGQGPYSEICTFAENDGSITIGVTGHGDTDFDGLLDSTQAQFYDFLEFLYIRYQWGPGRNGFVHGASTKDDSYSDVIRYPRTIIDPITHAAVPLWETYPNFFAPGAPPESRFDHGICGGYCIKVQKATHVAGGSSGGGAVMDGHRADLDGNGRVNSVDLALLLSYWGPVNR